MRATTAAPTASASEHVVIGKTGAGGFVHGGVSPHNNPALQAVQLATLSGFGLNWPLGADNLLVVSVGTGTPPGTQTKKGMAATHGIAALSSLMDDCGQLVETMMQWMSDSPTARVIDGAMRDLRGDLLGDRPAFQYVRYDVYDDRRWLPDHLGRDLDPQERRALTRMDVPSDVPILDALGIEAADKLVKPEHLPAWFDPAP